MTVSYLQYVHFAAVTVVTRVTTHDEDELNQIFFLNEINLPTYVYCDVVDANGDDDGKNRVSDATLLQPFGCLMASF